MRILIQQAVFGPLKGHAFLRGSENSLEAEFRDAAWRTDLPQTAPTGISWAPFFRLVQHKDWLMLIHTRPAEQAARGGMVFSRAAFIPLSIVEAFGDLRTLSNLLQMPWSKDDNLPPIAPNATAMGERPHSPPALTAQIAAALSRTPQRPIVVTPQQGFDNAMLDLWTRVPPEFRKSLTFGLSFGPDDVRELSVVCTPKELAARWAPSVLVDASDQETVCSHTATLLDLPLDSSVRAFAKSVELRLDSSTAIAIALQAADLWTNGDKPSDYIQLLRILAARAGTGTEATAVKTTVIERLVGAAGGWTEQDVLLMRNLNLTALPSATKITECLSNWVVTQRPTTFSQGLADILNSWAAEKATPTWLGTVSKGFEAAFAAKNVGDSLFTLVWQVTAKFPEGIERIWSLVASTAIMEKRMLSSMDNSIAEPLANALLPEAVSRGWWAIAGALLARSRAAAQALNDALEVAPANAISKFQLVASALGESSDTQAVTVGVRSRDATAIQVAADACLRTPATLLGFDWSDLAWFLLLGHALEKSTDIVDALPNVTTGVGQTIACRLTEEAVWRAISMCSLADLIDVQGRSEAWALIPKEYADTVKSATAKSWLTRFENGSVVASQLESELAVAVSKKVYARGYLVDVLRRTPAALPRFLTDFTFESDRDSAQFLEDVQRSDLRLSESAASTLGSIALSNSWYETARSAKDAFHFRNDFHPVLKECLKLLSYLDQLWVTLRLNLPLHFSADDAWQAFEAEAVTMYPAGPWDRELWSRSGGKNEDLVHEQTGKASWHRCTRNLRSGMAPGVGALLHVMLEDFNHSDTLRQLLRQKFW